MDRETALKSARLILDHGELFYETLPFMIVTTDLELREFVEVDHSIWDEWISLLHKHNLYMIVDRMVEWRNHAKVLEEMVEILGQDVDTQDLYQEVFEKGHYQLPTWVPADVRYRDKEINKEEEKDLGPVSEKNS